MKFSVLLPTRNRLDFLKYAVASVLKQNYANWEIIISDNASSENVEDYVRSLNEPRIKYTRSDEFLTVTENWNRCLDLCNGDYVLMLGDDDFLLKNYFQITRNLIENFQQPDLIYSNAFLFAYPGVLPTFPQGLFQTFGSLNAMPQHEFPFWLEQKQRYEIVQQTLRFVPVYGTNMQHALIHRTLIDKIKRKGQFFHSPYPDVYAMSALFLEAPRVLIYPKEIIVIGITPKSHGYYFFNNKEKEGVEFLNIQKEMNAIPSVQSILLPAAGSMLTFWLGAMEMLKIHFPLKKYKLKLEYKKYREGQINHVLHKYMGDKEKYRDEFKLLMENLSISEKLFNVWPRIASPIVQKKIPNYLINLGRSIRQRMQRMNSTVKLACSPTTNAAENKFSNPLEIFEQVEPIDCSVREKSG